MHVLIINGSPRIKAHSNTDKIIDKFGEGLKEAGSTYEQYEVSDRKQWDAIRDAFAKAENILIAIPLYVENIPGLLLEFLETVPARKGDANIAFILQGGFAEGIQLRCGEEYLKILTKQLGCNYKGTLVKGDNFSIRFFEGKQRDKVTGPYKNMGVIFGKNGDFNSEECKKFTGPEIFPAPTRLLIGTIFKTVAKKGFAQIAKGWGCTTPLDFRPY
ncbi:MAG: NAD(P)H-dependent oxidoreductase [Clostridiales bacterium]|nr:NAD(P)H-dependent oxidoreductase [Clostridiales bacterium]